MIPKKSTEMEESITKTINICGNVDLKIVVIICFHIKICKN